MTEENLFLLLCYLILGITLTIFAIRSRNRRRTVLINLIVAAFYSGLFFYNLKYNSSGGTGLLWYFYLVCSIGLHWLVNLIGIFLTFANIRRGSKPTKNIY